MLPASPSVISRRHSSSPAVPRVDAAGPRRARPVEAGRGAHLRRRLRDAARRLVDRAHARGRAFSQGAAALLPHRGAERARLLAAPAAARRGAACDRVLYRARAPLLRPRRARAERARRRRARGGAPARLLRARACAATSSSRTSRARRLRDGVLRLRARACADRSAASGSAPGSASCSCRSASRKRSSSRSSPCCCRS